VAFIVLNTQQVSVDWIVTTTKTPLIVVILLSLAVGGIFVTAALGMRRRSARRKRRAARAERSHPADQRERAFMPPDAFSGQPRPPQE
jgi:uncharacterized integral membrane protein